jgi:hypothetical protein
MFAVGKSASFPAYMIRVLAVEDFNEPRRAIHLEVEEGDVAPIVNPEMIAEAGAAYSSRGIPIVGAMDIEPVARLVARAVVGTGITLAVGDAANLVQGDPGSGRDVLKKPVRVRAPPQGDTPGPLSLKNPSLVA